MTTVDYTNAPYWAISGIGYGKGRTVTEAYENYVQTQLRNMPAKHTIFGTKAKWEDALRNGEARPAIWRAPEGTVGFVMASGILWEVEGEEKRVPATEDQLVEQGGPRDA